MTLSIEHVDLNIKKDKILTDISLELEQGKIYGMLGRNGAGKSSLLSLIASYRKTTNGKITLDSKTVYENDAVMKHINFLYNVKDASGETDTVKEYIESGPIYRDDFDTDYGFTLLKTFDIDKDKKDRKSTRLNSSHVSISYAVFCLKKKIIIEVTIDVFYLESVIDKDH